MQDNRIEFTNFLYSLKSDDERLIECVIDAYAVIMESSMSINNKIRGGKADGLTVSDIADKHDVDVSQIESQLRKGVLVELEHTGDEEIAHEIAMDHLSEFPDYYDRLRDMEALA